MYGFITLPGGLIFDLIEHPWFQRLRRIVQLGMTHYVYPGALHTRFHHALGAAHLMSQAIDTLRQKGHEITDEEAEAVMVGILLHDIGHGPFSHTLERTLVQGVGHEFMSELIMDALNKEFDGRLDLALKIFRNEYHKKFLHQLISSQLDVDRLDYLKRDSFFTGVHEGVIGVDRIIKMLEVRNDSLVVEAKGIYSIEKFLVARRLMYWQVYLHKTVICAEQMLVQVLMRAKHLAEQGEELFCTPALHFFLHNKVDKDIFINNAQALQYFTRLDDIDVMACIKVWAMHDDKILSFLSKSLIDRRLFRVNIQKETVSLQTLNELRRKAIALYTLKSDTEAGYLVFTGSTSNSIYTRKQPSINILFKDGSLKDITEASDHFDIAVAGEPVTKYYVCYPKQLD